MLLLLLLATLSADPAESMSVRKSTRNMAFCVQSQISQLDDGVSDARTIADGAMAACGGARSLLRRVWARTVDELAEKSAKKTGETVSDTEKHTLVEDAMTKLDSSLQENSVRWVLQKRAAKSGTEKPTEQPLQSGAPSWE
jgi:hypothetical protein